MLNRHQELTVCMLMNCEPRLVVRMSSYSENVYEGKCRMASLPTPR